MKKRLETPYATVHFVNHSHIDHTWWDSPQACRERNEEIIDQVLSLCASEPDFTFSYETTAALMDYLEKRPDRKQAISDLIEAGRVDVGGLFASVNADACSEETIARNFSFGKRWLEETLSYSPTLAKEHDTPGHTLQMPQLVKSAGMDVLVITRGPRGGFRWKGPDGSEVFTFSVPYNWSYWRKLGVSLEQTESILPTELERAAEWYAGSDIIIPDGDDMTLPNPRLVEIVRGWNERYSRPRLALSTMHDAIARIRSQRFGRRSGDMPNLWVVVHALQVETTRNLKTLQNLLPAAETLHALFCIKKNTFKHYLSDKIDSCWKRTLLVADHNWGGKDKDSHGDEGDGHKAKVTREALEECHRIVGAAFQDIFYSLPKQDKAEGMPVLVFNPVAWERTDVITAEIECSIPGLEAIEVVDAHGEAVPFCATVIERHRDDTVKRVSADFLARDLPSLGYSTYCVKTLLERKEHGAEEAQDATAIENEFYRVEFSEDGSSIRSLYDKEHDLELAGAFGTSVGPFEFEFGMFELFGIGLRLTVPERSFFENPENEGTGESVEVTGELLRASDHPASVKAARHGSLSQSLIAEGAFGESRRRQKVVLYNGIKRVDFHLELDWAGTPDMVLYLQMPNTLMAGRTLIDVPFAVHEMGNELTDFWYDEAMPITFKARGVQDWVGFEHDGHGLAIATRWPMMDFTLVPSFPLMWTNNTSGFFFGDRYRQVGTHTYSFSLTSYRGTWQENAIHRWGREWAKQPLTFLGDAMPVETRCSYVSVEPDNVVMTALKKAQGEDAIVARLFEVAGKKTTARLTVPFPVKRARTTNIIETVSKRLGSEGNSVQLSFKPHEIKTVKLYL
jgi:alpha-mannosidase